MTLHRLSILALAGLGAVTATPAVAQDKAEALTVSGGAALVSDYRFRGISQTDRKFAVQGTISLAHESGLYATLWGSSIDDYVAAGADQEIDLVAGLKHGFGETSVDVGATVYLYPGAAGGTDTNFVEPFVAVTQGIGPASLKILAAYAPRQKALGVGNGKEDNVYLAGDLSAALPGTPITLTAHVGHSWGPSYLTIGDEYTDWSLTASAAVRNLSLSVSLVDTDKSAFSPSGRNISKAGVVASLAVAF